VIEGRDYQIRTLKLQIPTLWYSGKRAPLIVAPVGAGKTRMAAMLAESRVQKDTADFWHVAHRRELIEQPYRLFRGFGIPCSKVLMGDEVDPSSPCRIASVQTLIRRELHPRRKRAVLSIDEAHRSVGPTYLKLIERFRFEYDEVYIVLWTATPYRLDGKPLSDAADSLYEAITPGELIDRGILHDPLVLGLQEPNLDGVPIRAGEFVQEVVAERSEGLVGNVVESWKRYAEGKPTVLFAVNVAHSMHLVDRLVGAGVRAAHLDANTPLLERERMLARLAIGGSASDHPEALDVICNVGILQEGWDSESDYARVLEDKSLWLGHSYPPEYVPLAVLVDAAPTESTCVYRQREGRVCRTHARKDKALIISHSGNWKRHGFLRQHTGFKLGDPTPAAVRSRESKKLGSPLGGAVHCPGCLAAWPVGVRICGICGTELAPATVLPEETDDELTLVATGQARGHICDPLVEGNYLRALIVSKAKKDKERRSQGKPPYKPSWVGVLFQKRFGHWPAPHAMAIAQEEARKNGS